MEQSGSNKQQAEVFPLHFIHTGPLVSRAHWTHWPRGDMWLVQPLSQQYCGDEHNERQTTRLTQTRLFIADFKWNWQPHKGALWICSQAINCLTVRNVEFSQMNNHLFPLPFQIYSRMYSDHQVPVVLLCPKLNNKHDLHFAKFTVGHHMTAQ